MPTEPEKIPADALTDETSTESSLRRIAESVRALDEADEAVLHTGLILADAKDDHKKARSLANRLRQELRDTAKGETVELPLWPRFNGGGETPAHPGSNGVADTASDDQAAMSFLLMLIPGLPWTVADQLDRRGIRTIGDLAAFTGGGANLTDIKGIGPESADKAIAALDEFWRIRRGGKP